MKTKHTAVPWFWHKGALGPFIVNQAGLVIARLDESDNDKEIEEDEKNTEFIVRACNAHDDLVYALKMLKQEVWADVKVLACVDGRIMDMVDAALAKAEGK